MDKVQEVHTSAAEKALEMHISELSSGTELSFDQMKEICGRDVKKDRYIVATVQRRLIRHHAKVLHSIRGYGYRVAHNNEVAAISQDYRKQGTRKFDKAVRIISTVDMSALNQEERRALINEQAKSSVCLMIAKQVDKPLPGIKDRNRQTIKIPTQGEVVLLLTNGGIK